MKQRHKALLIAMSIGDGYIHKDKRQPNAAKLALKLCHCEAQREYLQHKVDLLHSILGGKKPKVVDCLHRWPDGSTYRQVRAEKAHRYFRVLRRWVRRDRFSIDLLKHMTPESLAIWYMDDGSITANNRHKDGTCSSARTNIHICGTKDQAKVVCDYFRDYWGIKFTPYREKGRYSVRCFHREGAKFHKLIHPYIVPCMSYKQRFYFDTSA